MAWWESWFGEEYLELYPHRGPDDARREVAFALERYAGLDIVVNCAAILRDGFVFKADRVDFEQVLQVNLTAAFATIRAAAPVLRENAKSGRGGAPYRWGRVASRVLRPSRNSGPSPQARLPRYFRRSIRRADNRARALSSQAEAMTALPSGQAPFP